MAVDTRNRRASCIGFNAPFRAVYPNPDGSLANQADRQHTGYTYPGVPGDVPSTGAGARALPAGTSRVTATPAGSGRVQAKSAGST